MYSIALKDNSKDIDIVVMRSLLTLAGLAAYFYRADNYIVINIIIAIILLAAASGVRFLISVLKIKKIVLLGSAALLLFVATHAVTFSLLLVVFGMLSSFIYKKPVVMLTPTNVVLKSSKGISSYHWDEFENIVLKDNLLTLDFKNNKLLQLDAEVPGKPVDESVFNNFCDACISAVKK